MISSDKLEKVISICDKNEATAEEILGGCGVVCKLLVSESKPGSELRKGLLSCSRTRKGELALCLWQVNDKTGKFERVKHFGMTLPNMITLRGFIDVTARINIFLTNE